MVRFEHDALNACIPGLAGGPAMIYSLRRMVARARNTNQQAMNGRK